MDQEKEKQEEKQTPSAEDILLHNMSFLTGCRMRLLNILKAMEKLIARMNVLFESMRENNNRDKF